MQHNQGGELGVILAGGKGERLRGVHTREKPLAMVKGAQLVLHVARALAKAGVRRVVALTGENHARVLAGLSLESNRAIVLDHGEPVVELELRFSGEEAGTGGRLLTLDRGELANGALLSYTDIASNAPLGALSELRRAHEASCAVLSVHPHEPWGRLEVANGRVIRFAEKQVLTDVWINGGVLALAPDIQDFIEDPREMLEVEVMERLLARGVVMAHPFEGWWQAVDTQKDLKIANTCEQAAQHLSDGLTLRPL